VTGLHHRRGILTGRLSDEFQKGEKMTHVERLPPPIQRRDAGLCKVYIYFLHATKVHHYLANFKGTCSCEIGNQHMHASRINHVCMQESDGGESECCLDMQLACCMHSPPPPPPPERTAVTCLFWVGHSRPRGILCVHSFAQQKLPKHSCFILFAKT
jgi:hypothetical protein